MAPAGSAAAPPQQQAGGALRQPKAHRAPAASKRLCKPAYSGASSQRAKQSKRSNREPSTPSTQLKAQPGVSSPALHQRGLLRLPQKGQARHYPRAHLMLRQRQHAILSRFWLWQKAAPAWLKNKWQVLICGPGEGRLGLQYLVLTYNARKKLWPFGEKLWSNNYGQKMYAMVISGVPTLSNKGQNCCALL